MDKSKTTVIIISVLAVALVVITVLLFTEKQTNKELVQEFELEKEDLENQYTDFAKQYDELKCQFELFKEQARLELGEKNREIVALSARVEELENRCDELRVARSLAGEGESPSDAKRRLSGIVREIDKCIALLGG